MQPHQLALLMVCALAIASDKPFGGNVVRRTIWGDMAQTRVALILLANAAAYWWLFWMEGNANTNFPGMILVDVVSAWAVLRSPAGTMQGLIGFTFAMQIGANAKALAETVSGANIRLIEVATNDFIVYLFYCQLVCMVWWSWTGGNADYRRIPVRSYVDLPPVVERGLWP